MRWRTSPGRPGREMVSGCQRRRSRPAGPQPAATPSPVSGSPRGACRGLRLPGGAGPWSMAGAVTMTTLADLRRDDASSIANSTASSAPLRRQLDACGSERADCLVMQSVPRHKHTAFPGDLSQLAHGVANEAICSSVRRRISVTGSSPARGAMACPGLQWSPGRSSGTACRRRRRRSGSALPRGRHFDGHPASRRPGCSPPRSSG